MKRIILITALLMVSVARMSAQYDFLIANRNVIPGGYDFWIYTPEDYYYTMGSAVTVRWTLSSREGRYRRLS